MAIQTSRTLGQLKQECKNLGLEVKIAGKKEQKQDYILALREHYLKTNYTKVPKALELMLQVESLMLCQQYKVLKPEEQADIWNSKHWFLEEKEDGNRMAIVYTPEEGFDFFSRNNSVTDFLPISYKENIYTEDLDLSQLKNSFILDAEVISTDPNINTLMANKYGCITETQLQAVTALLALEPSESIRIQKESGYPLQFKIFDCLYYDGEWIKHKPLIERRKFMKEGLQQLQAAGLNCKMPESNISNKKAFHEMIIKRGGEGTIAKNLYSPYIDSSSRRRDGWVKIKRTMSESLQMEGLGDTLDGWISGFEPADEDKSWAGLVGALEISLYVKDAEGNLREHMIAKVANIPMDLRKQMTEYDENNQPILKKEFYGRTVEIDGQAVSAREKRLKHAILLGFRPDKNADDCIIEEEFLNSMIL